MTYRRPGKGELSERQMAARKAKDRGGKFILAKGYFEEIEVGGVVHRRLFKSYREYLEEQNE